MNPGPYTVEGTASSDLDLVKVEVRMDRGDWEAAEPTKLWKFNTQLTTGMHAISARATDSAGRSAQADVTVEVK